jgi:antitoxin (DNA-binding transcriptional repressor) of toxin-antitoxin stability system
MNEIRVSAEQFRRQLAIFLNRVGYGGERIVIERHGAPLAILAPYHAPQGVNRNGIASPAPTGAPKIELHDEASKQEGEQRGEAEFDAIDHQLLQQRLHSLREHFPQYWHLVGEQLADELIEAPTSALPG